jgi:diguanylate cyclase (GGDEF)-like protein
MTRAAIHPRDRHAASRAVAYLCVAAMPFIVVSMILLPEFVGSGTVAAVNVIVVDALLGLGGFVCWRYPERLPDWFWVATPIGATTAIAWLDLVTNDAGVTGQIFFLLPVLYAATFLRRPYVCLVLAAVLVAECVVTLSLLPAAKAVSDIIGLMTTLGMSTVIVVVLRERRDQVLDVLESQALADPLTGLPNRRAFDRDLAHEAAWVRRSGGPLALLTVDLDHFKTINDTWGHAVGDRALQSVARAMREVLRDADVVARLGGDEFVMLLRADTTGATRAADAVRRRVAVATDVPGGAPTLSIGIAVLPDNADTVEGLLAASDAALYEAKVHGRNRTACAGPATGRPTNPATDPATGWAADRSLR